MNVVEFKGRWWLANDPENQVAGAFKYTPEEGCSVSLFGAFPGAPPTLPVMPRFPLVHGYNLETAQPVTIHDCFVTATPISASRSGIVIELEDFVARYAFVGKHFDSVDDIRFHKAYVEMSFLREWLGINRPRYNSDPKENHRFDVVFPPFQSAPITNNVGTFTINRRHLPTSSRSYGFAVAEADSIVIELPIERSFTEWKEEIFAPLSTFLTLATDRWSIIQSSAMFYRSERDEAVDAYAIYQQRDYGNVGVIDTIFSYDEVKDDLGGILERWFGITEKYKAPCELYFNVVLTPRMYINNHFLNLVQALESFHRIRSGTNVGTLYDRLLALADEVQTIIPKVLSDKEAFVRKVVDTRNYYTHYSADKYARAAHGQDLRCLSLDLKQFMQVVLLRALDLPEPLYQQLFRELTFVGPPSS